tara:strand:- start:532 stop:969 length:438 start_codon:yes stop_codon:yes gene_type:complete
MKNNILIIALLITTLSFSQVLTKKVKRIAKKNVDIFLSSKFDKNAPFIVVAEKGNRKVDDKNEGIANYLTNALMEFGEDVVVDGKGNTIKFTIKWGAFDELKRLSATIYNYDSKVVGTIQYNGPYLPNNHMNIAKGVAYKIVSAK